jgi:hypothetical protein
MTIKQIKTDKNKTNMKRLQAVIFGLSALVPVLSLQADSVAIQSFADGSGTSGSGCTAGWVFEANSDITVTQLGFYNTGLSGPVPVGLWDSSGNLLGSVTVNAGDPSLNNFLYDPVSGIPLTAGQTYTIGALQTYATVWGTSDSLVTAPQVSFEENAFIYNGTLTDPTSTDSGQEIGYFGPNFQFTASAPEHPSLLVTLALLIIPLVHGVQYLKTRRAD